MLKSLFPQQISALSAKEFYNVLDSVKLALRAEIELNLTKLNEAGSDVDKLLVYLSQLLSTLETVIKAINDLDNLEDKITKVMMDVVKAVNKVDTAYNMRETI
jgi:hypothetical protein